MKKFVLPLLVVAVAAVIFLKGSRARHVVLVGWDGVRIESVERLLAQGELPNLAAVLKTGSLVRVEIREGKTETKPGWAQILTGLDINPVGVISNKNYRALPKGTTVGEMLREQFGAKVHVVHIAAKPQNLSGRGPHRVCGNCVLRDPVTKEEADWHNEFTKVPTVDGGPKKLEYRDGEPFFHLAQVADWFQTGLRKAPLVVDSFRQSLKTLGGKRLFALVHFEETDDTSHMHGWHSVEQKKAILLMDRSLGELMQVIRERGIEKDTVVLVTSDHGFDDLAPFTHRQAPHVFLAANRNVLKRPGDRRDVAPTLLDLFGAKILDTGFKVTGRSLVR